MRGLIAIFIYCALPGAAPIFAQGRGAGGPGRGGEPTVRLSHRPEAFASIRTFAAEAIGWNIGVRTAALRQSTFAGARPKPTRWILPGSRAPVRSNSAPTFPKSLITT
jgi:hypothetical protein